MLLAQHSIIERPIDYGPERRQLSTEYLQQRHGLKATSPDIKPTMIVLHYTGGGTAESNFKYFNSPYLENGRPLNKKESPLNVSAHYLVDRDGTIYHLVPDTLLARHAIGLNYTALGVENIGSEKQPLTAAQAEANAWLVRQLAAKYPIRYLIGHSEYTRFRQSSLWKETNPNYITYKSDPGEDFMKKVRTRVQDLNLKSAP